MAVLLHNNHMTYVSIIGIPEHCKCIGESMSELWVCIPVLLFAGHQGSIIVSPRVSVPSLWNRRDHSPAQGVRRMYFVFSGLSLVCTAYMSIIFGVGS